MPQQCTRTHTHRSNELLITPWVFCRYMIIGVYVGIATVGAFVSWYMFDHFMGIDLSKDGHSTVTWSQLTNWQQCSSWDGFKASNFTAGDQTIAFENPCDYFTVRAVNLHLRCYGMCRRHVVARNSLIWGQVS